MKTFLIAILLVGCSQAFADQVTTISIERNYSKPDCWFVFDKEASIPIKVANCEKITIRHFKSVDDSVAH